MAQWDTFAIQATPDSAGATDLRLFQVGRALVYTGRPGHPAFPNGTIVRPRADNPNGARVYVRSDTDATVDFAFADELTATAVQQLAGP